MAKRSEKPTMMRFEPQSGWSEAPGQVISINEHMREVRDPGTDSADQSALEAIPSDALVDIGESMQEVFESLKISDPRGSLILRLSNTSCIDSPISTSASEGMASKADWSALSVPGSRTSRICSLMEITCPGASLQPD